MIQLFTLIFIAVSLLLLGSAPWISALLYSLVSVMQPQYIWFWAFESFSVFKVSAGIAIIAWGWHMLQGNINWEVYKSGQFKGMFLLLIIYYLSDILSPFDTFTSSVSAGLVLDIFTTIFIMYFILLGIINNTNAMKYFGYMMIFITIYYAYWANDHYISGNWGQFTNGRLDGPLGSPYSDGNATSIVLTTGISFVMFGARLVEKRWQRIALLLSIPLIWHALILFASRGALLSAACATLFFALVVRSKMLNGVLLAGFLAMLVWQGGMLMSRTSSTVAQSQNANVEEPLNPRLVSWQVGWGLMLEYPLLGVGPERFLYASALHYPGKSAHVAHSTFFNFAANTGIPAGIIYLSFFWISFKQFRYVQKKVTDNPQIEFVNYSCMGSLIAFFVGAIFLDLILFEPFYFLLVLMTTNYYLVKKSETQKATSLTNQLHRGKA